MATTNVYVLKLEGGRYYVGKSDDVVNRYQQHMNGHGSAWTRKYKPIGVAQIIENVSLFEEDKITKEYMSKYGIDKVRGGSYVEINLSEFHIEALKMEIWAANNLCTICGRSGHFAKNCYAKTDASGNTIQEESNKEFDKESDEESDEDDEEEVVWECSYCDRQFDTEYGCGVHERYCKKTETNVKKSKPKTGACYRCGRPGHYSPDCYARSHSDGYELDSDEESD